MNNPATEAPTDGTSTSADADLSFLADFDSQVMGKESTLSEESERPSEPETDAAEDAPADAQTALDADEPSDPQAPENQAQDDIPYEPLAYTVNGQSKNVDWALKVGDDGVVIPPQHIGKLQDLIQRDEWQNAQNRELYAKTQQYEALSHKVGDQEYRGIDAFRQLQAEKAMLDASGGRILQALANPQFVTDLALAYQAGDQTEVQRVLADVIQQVKFAGERAQFDTIRTLSQQAQDASRQQEMTQTQDTEYRQIVSDFGRALPDLTPDDLRAMYEHFGAFRDRIFRPATPDEARQLGVRVGAVIKDPTVMYAWAQDRAALRRQYTDATRAAQNAAKENAARQSRPTAPKKGKSARPAAPQAKAGEKFAGDDGSYAAWKKRLEAGKWAHEDTDN